jgi:hypothetical protein
MTERDPAAKVAFIRQRLTTYFIGTEAPDTNKKIPSVTEGGYHDSGACHCILFAELHAAYESAVDRRVDFMTTVQVCSIRS